MIKKQVPERSYHGIAFVTMHTNKKHLAEDFSHRCAYCDDLDFYGGGYRAYQVEHFAPQSKFPKLTNNYKYLVACESVVSAFFGKMDLARFASQLHSLKDEM